MSDTDPKKDHQNEEPDIDDELESLSADEKAAFDKIMAEISAATGVTEDKGSETEPTPNEKETNSAALTSQNESAPPENQTGSAVTTNSDDQEDNKSGNTTLSQDDLDALMAGMTIESEEDAEDTETEEVVPEVPESDDAPAPDQQAAMDEIMAQIESRSKSESIAPSSDSQAEVDEAPAEEDQLDEDQQAAMNQIMAEIESRRSPESIAPSSDSQAEEDKAPAEEDSLDEDQQAAMDQIMAEISAKRKGETVETASESDAENDDLDEDQQAAMDQIMAEIESKRNIENKNTGEDKDADTPEPMPDESEADTAAMDKIMAEIAAQKSGAQSSSKEPVDEADNDNKPVANGGKSELTMEEFDDELNNLLSAANSKEDTSPGDQKDKQTSQTVAKKSNSKENVNAALKAALEKAPNDSACDDENGDTREATLGKKDITQPILHEITDTSKTSKAKKAKKPKMGRRFGWFSFGATPWRIVRIGLPSLAAASLLAYGAYWGYTHLIKDNETTSPTATSTTTPSTIHQDQNVSLSPSPPPQTVSHNDIASDKTLRPDETRYGKDGSPPSAENNVAALERLVADLSSARQKVQEKIRDVEQLKSYYARGIDEETVKIEDLLENGKIPTYNQAVSNKKIELGLRAIQRRMVYMEKLDTPLTQLTAMSEALLFLSRKASTYNILENGIIGLPVDDFSREAESTMQSYLQYNTQLSIDRVSVPSPPLASIWSNITSDLSKKADMLARRMPLNRAISKEICRGNYERKYQLTAMSAQTAQCLIKWSGKDMYLNALSELTPDVAQVLAQWPGEWLSLNGLRELSAETAAKLAQWQGRRLSLNGLTALSQEATANLAQWRGEQLEMVGLQKIGRWENYGTRLFLSEKLRRRLEEQ